METGILKAGESYKMKLTDSQKKVLKKAYDDINCAIAFDYPEWFRVKQTGVPDTERCIKEGYLKEWWERNRNRIVCVHCNSRTIKKLEKLDIIEIIEDSYITGGTIDIIKIKEEIL